MSKELKKLIKNLPKSKLPTAAEIAKAWIEFKPVVPLTYIVAARRAARNK